MGPPSAGSSWGWKPRCWHCWRTFTPPGSARRNIPYLLQHSMDTGNVKQSSLHEIIKWLYWVGAYYASYREGSVGAITMAMASCSMICSRKTSRHELNIHIHTRSSTKSLTKRSSVIPPNTAVSRKSDTTNSSCFVPGLAQPQQTTQSNWQEIRPQPSTYGLMRPDNNIETGLPSAFKELSSSLYDLWWHETDQIVAHEVSNFTCLPNTKQLQVQSHYLIGVMSMEINGWHKTSLWRMSLERKQTSQQMES